MNLDTVIQSDAITFLQSLPDQCADAVITDPPYNITELAFEMAIDWAEYWRQVRRIVRDPAAPAIMFSQQPFTTDLICSNRQGWRYEIIWEKTMPVGFLDANRRPLRCHENIQIFADAMPHYTPVKEQSNVLRATARKRDGGADHYNTHERKTTWQDNGMRFPRSVWKFAQRHNAFENTETLHPTEKPVALMEKLIETYTIKDMVIVDCFAGSGSTLIAARNLSRHYVGCDIDPEYVNRSLQRLAEPFTYRMF